MITEDYVSYETAKLLKEKGFDAECDYLYVDGELVRTHGFACNWNNGETLFTDYKNECSAPTLQMTLKWLREAHNIFIDIVSRFAMNADKDVCFSYSCKKLIGTYKSCYEHSDGEWWNYEHACESAIRYCLENLI